MLPALVAGLLDEGCEFLEGGGESGRVVSGGLAASYTNLTRPTNREGKISGVAVSLKKKKTDKQRDMQHIILH